LRLKLGRAVSIVPSYLMILVIMTIAGIILSGVIAHVFLPLTKQSGYYGRSIEYQYKIDSDAVVITIANKKNYEAKVDVLLIDQSNKVLTSCQGYLRSNIANKTTVGAFSLMGLNIMPGEIVDITCPNNPPIKDVKVYEYGVPEGKQNEAFIGTLPGGYYGGDVGFGLGTPWQFSGLYFRLPATVVATTTYNPAAFVILKLSQNTLPSVLWQFFKTHTRPDLKDVLVVDLKGVRYPTKAVKNADGTIDVYFKVDNLEPGVYYYFIYFGNPYLENPPYPLTDNIDPAKTISTPTSLPNTITSSMAYPSFLIPEANWLPQSEGIRHGVVYYGGKENFNNIYNWLKSGNPDKVRDIIKNASNNLVYFPVGTKSSAYWDYRDKNPKTVYGLAPWYVVTVAFLPSLGYIPNTTTVTTRLWISSDDGSSAYIVALNNNQIVFRGTYVDNAYSSHGPSYWNYQNIQLSLDVKKVSGSTPYLIILTQNGVVSGGGPGYQDFRFIMWYVEQMGPNAPSESEFISIPSYIEVKVNGLPSEDLSGYAFPVDLTGRTDVDWSRFNPSTVYVVDEGNNPVYYWVQVEGGRTIVWFKIDQLPARSTRTFRIYYGGVNKYPIYNDPSKVFVFFDDFDSDPTKNGKWDVYIFGRGGLWDSNQKVFYMINNEYYTGVAMFMKLDWRNNFHVHFRAYISGSADGLAFTFFKDSYTYRLGVPYTGGSLALDVVKIPEAIIVKSEGYAVEFDIYRNSGEYYYSIPHIYLVETFSSTDVSDNTHYGSYTSTSFKGSWVSVDIYYYNGILRVYVNNNIALSYSYGIFSQYGIKYGGMGITAGTGGQTGTFAVDTVFLRYYPGQEPTATIQGYK